MSGVLVDSSVVLDVLGDDPAWYRWSEAALARQMTRATLWINAVIYAEVSIGFERIEEVEAALARLGLLMRTIPREALFLAGKAYVQYRKRGGARPSPLPDFFIAAHAAVEGLTLLTRDPARARTHFPSVRIISPDQPRRG